MQERLFAHPTATLCGLGVWLFLVIWVYALLAWLIQGDIDFPVALIGICLAFVLGYFTVNPPRPEMAGWFFAIAALTVILFPVGRYYVNQRDLTQMDIEQVELAYITLGQRPKNPALRFRLAKAVYSRGMIQAAIAIAEPIMPELSKQHYNEEHKQFVTWKHYATGSVPTSFGCLECGYHNRRGDVFCQGCGGRLFLGHAEGKWMGSHFARKFVASWACLVLMGGGIPIALTSLPIAEAIPVVVGIVGISTYAFTSVFVRRERRA
jgi:hypothetical protein